MKKTIKVDKAQHNLQVVVDVVAKEMRLSPIEKALLPGTFGGIGIETQKLYSHCHCCGRKLRSIKSMLTGHGSGNCAKGCCLC